MRRSLVLVSVAGALVSAGLLLLKPTGSVAEPNKPDREGTVATRSGSATPLPIGQVVLYSSGVGYFQREGTVAGNSRVDLVFPVQDVKDLLQSLVVRDLDGGNVSTIAYDSNAPVERTLQSFAIN